MSAHNFKPGDIVYADGNAGYSDTCFGVVVDKEFWLQEAEKEGWATETMINNIHKDNYVGYRVLGSKLFTNQKRTWDGDDLEANDMAMMNYRARDAMYFQAVNLKPLMGVGGGEYGQHIRRLVFGAENEYFITALRDARVVYAYLEGERSELKAEDFNDMATVPDRNSKLLKLLEQAIPMEK